MMTAKGQNQATSKTPPVAEAFEAHACELPRPPEHEEKGIKEKGAIQKAAAGKVAEEKPAAEKAVVEAETSGSRATEAFEARSSEFLDRLKMQQPRRQQPRRANNQVPKNITPPLTRRVGQLKFRPKTPILQTAKPIPRNPCLISDVSVLRQFGRASPMEVRVAHLRF